MRAAILVLTLSLAGPAAAQGGRPKVVFQGLPSVVRQGERIEATLRVESSAPVSTPRVAEVAGLRIAVGGPRRSRQESFINGVHSISESTTFPIEILPLQLGKFEIPPFEFTVGGTRYTTEARALEVVKNIEGSNLAGLEVVAAKPRVYVHEPLTIDFECAIDGSLELRGGRARSTGEPFYFVQADVDWLAGGELDGWQLVEAPETDSDQRVNILLGDRLQPADVAASKVDGRTRNVFRFRKTLLPTRAGQRRLAAPLLRFTVLTSRHVDLFGEERRGTKDYVVAGQPLEVEVVPLPKAGRPEPFFGGVGRFTVAARFDKRSVPVGGSVKLILTIAGVGNMDHLQVPALDDLPGFHLLGKIENRAKDKVEVVYDLSPKTAEVRGAPAIAWNYFDIAPGVERYVTVRTEPLALEVKAIAGETSLPELPGVAAKAVEPGVDDIFDVKLAGEGPDRGAPPRIGPLPGTGATLFWALLPWLICGLGTWFWRAHRRARADVRGRRRRGAGRKFQAALAAGAAPVDALAGYLADRLGCEPAAVIGPDLAERLVGAGIDAALAQRFQQLIEQGVAARYGGVGGGLDRAAVEAAVAVVEKGSVGAGPLLLGCVVLAGSLGAPLAGQDLAKAEAAYRSGDYAAAAAGFGAAADRGDRRAAYNLGNALYRQGHFARALAAYEKARLAMPRDPELLANIRLVRERLGLGTAEGEAFSQTVVTIRDSFTPRERFWICILCNALAAALICFGGRRLRILGVVVTLPAVLLILEVAVLLPNRPPRGIVVDPEVALRSEPSADVAQLKRLRGGVAVEVLSGRSQTSWTQVRVDGRRGYLPSDALVVIE